MDDVIIMFTNILQEINYQELHHLLDPHRLYYTNYQITIAHNTSIIVVRKIYFTVVICVYLIALYLFLHKVITLKPLFIPLSINQRIAIRMRMRTHGHQTMVTETSKTNNFWVRSFYNMFLY